MCVTSLCIFFVGFEWSLNLEVILFKGGHVLSGLAELALLHPLAHVPVDEKQDVLLLYLVFYRVYQRIGKA